MRILFFIFFAVLLPSCSKSAFKDSIAVTPIFASLETDSIKGTGDRADDPAIWVNYDNPENSLILGTDKDYGLYVYALDGREKQFLNVGRINNVDVRGQIAVASNDEHEALSWFEISHSEDATVRLIGNTLVNKGEPYGVCLGYDKGLIAATTYKDGSIQIWKAKRNNITGEFHTTLSHIVKLSSQLEGCVFDETQSLLFIGEEGVGIWAVNYNNPNAKIFSIDKITNQNGLVADVEGLSLWKADNSGYLIASAQGANRYVIYDRFPPYNPRGVISITSSQDGMVDEVTHTDGLDVTSIALPGFPAGLLVVQDDGNPKSEQNQNFKLVDWQSIENALELNSGN